MKSIIFLLIPFISFSQKYSRLETPVLHEVDGVVIYTGQDSVKGASKSELYTRAKAWFVLNYRSANNVLQMEDPENGIIIGKGNFTTPYTVGMGMKADVRVNHTVKIFVKDEKVKYEISDFSGSYIWYNNPPKNMPIENVKQSFNKKNYQEFLENVDKDISALAASIMKAIKQPVVKDNW